MMASFSKTVHWIGMKLTRFVHTNVIIFLSKFCENVAYQFKYMLKSNSALFVDEHKKCVAAKLLEPIFYKI